MESEQNRFFSPGLELRSLKSGLIPRNSDVFNDSQLGRPEIEDKAKNYSLKLHDSHIEKLSLLPGKGLAEKVRYLIDNLYRYQERERLQAQNIANQIDKCFEYVSMIHDQDFSPNEVRKKANVARFLKEIERFDKAMDFYMFSKDDLTKIFDKIAVDKLEIIVWNKVHYTNRPTSEIF